MTSISSGRLRAALLLVTLSVAVAACGSTVPRAQLEASLAGQDAGLGPGVSAPGAGGAVPTGVPGAGGIPGAGGVPGAPGAQAPGTAGGGPLGPGITEDTIYVGASYIVNGGAANSAIGAANLDPGDWRKAYNAVIKQVNSEGGIAGRKVAPVYAGIDATSSRTIDQQAQSACAHWTQDNKVFAIVGGIQGNVVNECAEKARAVYIVSAAGSSTPDDFRRYPHYVEVSGMNVVRLGSVTVKGIAAQNYFDSGARLGIITWDAPNYRLSISEGFVPELENVGITLATPPVYVHVPQTFNDLGGMNSAVNSAVLKFASLEISHVLIVDGSAGICAGACLGYQFMNQAESQQYRPRYGFNEYNYADSSVGSLYPAAQMKRSVAVVWGDDSAEDDVGWRPNPAREKCYDLMRKEGVPMENANQLYGARNACETLWFLRAAVAKIGGATLNNDNFMAAVNQMGTSFQPLSTYLSRLSATQHDGASAVRNQSFFESCTCFRYTSNPYIV